MTSGPVLVADVGGTRARVALAEVGASVRVSREVVRPTAEFRSAAELLAGYLGQRKVPRLAGCGVCAAGPVTGEGALAAVRLTNAAIRITAAELREATGVERPVLLNDFCAVAHALPALDDGDLRFLGGGSAVAGAPRAVLGPGSGLGVSALLPAPGGDVALPGEGGHADLAAATEREDAVLRALRARHGHVSGETVLCGPGLERLYSALLEVRREDSAPLRARDVAAAAFDGENAAAIEAVELFTLWLGRVAGNLALTLGARGGVYLAGGILPGWGARFDAAVFRRGFEDKGRFRDYVRDIPAFLVTHPQPGLVGIARVAVAQQGGGGAFTRAPGVA